MKVAPSIIAGDFARYQEEIDAIQEAGADLLHLDIMDGVFVPNLTFGPMVVEAINRLTDIELDAHLMILHPEKYLMHFLDAGSDWLSFHHEATENPSVCIEKIRKHKVRAGLALNPPTPFTAVQRYIEECDFLIIMTVHPGFYGQKFIEEVLPKIAEARTWIERHRLRCLIEVDGGINAANVSAVCQAGADIVVAGAGVFKMDDYKTAIEKLRCLKD